MNNLTKVLLLILSVLAYSCEKKTTQDDEVIIFGKIVDWQTNAPFQGVSILKIYRHPDIFGNATYDTTLLTQTDIEGKFEIKLTLVSAYPSSYDILQAHYPGYSDGYIGGTRGAITECNIKLVKNSYLKVHLKNATPCNSSDWFNFGVGSNNGWSQDYWSFYNSNNLDTTLIVKVIPNYTHSIWWNATKCSIQTSGNENVYFTSGDTIYRSIFY